MQQQVTKSLQRVHKSEEHGDQLQEFWQGSHVDLFCPDCSRHASVNELSVLHPCD
jgi:hypothetical protein